FSGDAHFHIQFPNAYEASHGFGTNPGGGSDRLGLYFRREDSGPFDFLSLDYRVVTPTASNLYIGPNLNPAQPITTQLTPFALVADPNFQTLTSPNFHN